MRPRRWSPEVIAQAFHVQGVSWTEAEIRAESERLAREILRMDIRKHNADRKFYRNEIPMGHVEADQVQERMDSFNRRERFRREDWSCPRPGRKDAVLSRMAPFHS